MSDLWHGHFVAKDLQRWSLHVGSWICMIWITWHLDAHVDQAPAHFHLFCCAVFAHAQQTFLSYARMQTHQSMCMLSGKTIHAQWAWNVFFRHLRTRKLSNATNFQHPVLLPCCRQTSRACISWLLHVHCPESRASNSHTHVQESTQGICEKCPLYAHDHTPSGHYAYDSFSWHICVGIMLQMWLESWFRHIIWYTQDLENHLESGVCVSEASPTWMLTTEYKDNSEISQAIQVFLFSGKVQHAAVQHHQRHLDVSPHVFVSLCVWSLDANLLRVYMYLHTQAHAL